MNATDRQRVNDLVAEVHGLLLDVEERCRQLREQLAAADALGPAMPARESPLGGPVGGHPLPPPSSANP